MRNLKKKKQLSKLWESFTNKAVVELHDKMNIYLFTSRGFPEELWEKSGGFDCEGFSCINLLPTLAFFFFFLLFGESSAARRCSSTLTDSPLSGTRYIEAFQAFLGPASCSDSVRGKGWMKQRFLCVMSSGCPSAHL